MLDIRFSSHFFTDDLKPNQFVAIRQEDGEIGITSQPPSQEQIEDLWAKMGALTEWIKKEGATAYLRHCLQGKTVTRLHFIHNLRALRHLLVSFKNDSHFESFPHQNEHRKRKAESEGVTVIKKS